MFELIHKHKRLAATVIAIASISFLFWMFSVSDLKQMFGLKRCVADVEGQCITLREFRYSLLSLGDSENSKDLKMQVVNSLVVEHIVYQVSQTIGCFASFNEIATIIRKDPSFFKNNSFSPKLYTDIIKRMGITPAEYEEIMKRKLTMRKLSECIGKSVYLDENEVDIYKEIEGAKFSGRLYIFREEDIVDSIKINEDEIREYYNDHKSEFMTEKRVIYRVWETGDKMDAHKIYNGVKKGDYDIPGFIEITDKDIDSYGRAKEVFKTLTPENRVNIIKEGNRYYISLYYKEIQPELKDINEVKGDIVKRLKQEKAKKLVIDKANSTLSLLRDSRNVDAKYISFSDTGVDELRKIFLLGDLEIIKIVFSGDKVFGPYSFSEGYGVLYIKSVKRDRVKEASVNSYLYNVKSRQLFVDFIEHKLRKADIKLNDEILN